jgi:pimeloyl-ACP methyl ester carboxylesterase
LLDGEMACPTAERVRRGYTPAMTSQPDGRAAEGRTLVVQTPDGRTLAVSDAGAPVRTPDRAVDRARDAGTPDTGPSALTLVWHNGSPHTGRLLTPVVAAARARNIRVVTYARPGYGGSTPLPDRDVASAAADVAAIADALGLGRFTVAGYSGGGPHALACAAVLQDRVLATVTLASPVPYTDELDWFGGMAAPGALRSARQGREARARFAETDEFDPNIFTQADWDALRTEWSAVGDDAGAAGAAGTEGLIDDDVAFASPWGCDPSLISGPVLVVQGGEDRVIPRSHGESLLRRTPTAELWLRPRDGHVSILRAVPVALDWLVETISRD